MKTFTYISHKTINPEIVFVWEGESIIEADKTYKEATGEDVTKQPHIGVKVQTE